MTECPQGGCNHQQLLEVGESQASSLQGRLRLMDGRCATGGLQSGLSIVEGDHDGLWTDSVRGAPHTFVLRHWQRPHLYPHVCAFAQARIIESSPCFFARRLPSSKRRHLDRVEILLQMSQTHVPARLHSRKVCSLIRHQHHSHEPVVHEVEGRWRPLPIEKAVLGSDVVVPEAVIGSKLSLRPNFIASHSERPRSESCRYAGIRENNTHDQR